MAPHKSFTSTPRYEMCHFLSFFKYCIFQIFFCCNGGKFYLTHYQIPFPLVPLGLPKELRIPIQAGSYMKGPLVFDLYGYYQM